MGNVWKNLLVYIVSDGLTSNLNVVCGSTLAAESTTTKNSTTPTSRLSKPNSMVSSKELTSPKIFMTTATTLSKECKGGLKDEVSGNYNPANEV